MKLEEIVNTMDFDKIKRSGVSVNEQLAEELHKPVVKKFKRRKVNARYNPILGSGGFLAHHPLQLDIAFFC